MIGQGVYPPRFLLPVRSEKPANSRETLSRGTLPPHRQPISSVGPLVTSAAAQGLRTRIRFISRLSDVYVGMVERMSSQCFFHWERTITYTYLLLSLVFDPFRSF